MTCITESNIFKSLFSSHKRSIKKHWGITCFEIPFSQLSILLLYYHLNETVHNFQCNIPKWQLFFKILALCGVKYYIFRLVSAFHVSEHKNVKPNFNQSTESTFSPFYLYLAWKKKYPRRTAELKYIST